MTTRSIGLLLASLLLAAGCKHKHHDDDGPPPPTFLFYSNMTDQAGLWAVNPEAATPAAIQIEPDTASVMMPTLVQVGRWGGSSGTITGVYSRYVVYAKSASGEESTLFRVYTPASPDASAPVPEQVGAPVTGLCTFESRPDYARADDSLLAVTTAGADGSCGSADDVVILLSVTSDTAATGTALPAGARLVGVARSARDGAIVRWLVQDGGKLWAYDPNGDKQDLGAAELVALVVEWDGRTWLSVDRALKYYDAAAGELRSPAEGTTAFDDSDAYDTDATSLYFVSRTAGASIFAVPLDGSAAPHVVHTVEGTSPPTSLAVSSGRVIYVSDACYSVPKAGGAPVMLGPSSYNLTAVAGESLYFFEAASPSDPPTAAVSMKEDGTDVALHDTATNANWSVLGDTTVRMGTTRAFNPRYLFLIEVDAAGVHLTSYDAPTRVMLAAIADVPPDLAVSMAETMVESSGDATLVVEGVSVVSPEATQRISLVRAEQAGSRVPIATGAGGKDLWFVGGSGCSTAGTGGLGAIALVLLALRRRRACATAR